jgi:hypothetical protein
MLCLTSQVTHDAYGSVHGQAIELLILKWEEKGIEFIPPKEWESGRVPSNIWAAKLPLKIRIFTWQLALNCLPSSAARHGPGTGRCSLCGEVEDASHIFFNRSLVKFMLSVSRQLLRCNWSPTNFPQFYSLVSSLLGRHRRTVWALFAAQFWTLWHVRNKLTIESKVIRQPADVIFKTLIFLQLWELTAKPRDKSSLKWMVRRLREFHAACVPSDWFLSVDFCPIGLTWGQGRI